MPTHLYFTINGAVDMATQTPAPTDYETVEKTVTEALVAALDPLDLIAYTIMCNEGDRTPSRHDPVRLDFTVTGTADGDREHPTEYEAIAYAVDETVEAALQTLALGAYSFSFGEANEEDG